MKRISLVLIMFILAGLPLNARATDISARSYVVYEPLSGRVLFEKNKDEKRGMASTTKIVTAITAIEHGNLNDTVTASKKASTVEGSSIWLTEGESLSLENMLFGLMLSSGNDAAIAIAEHIAGSTEHFVELMGQTARLAGAYNSSFKNPNGLDEEGHYTTAEDLAKITAYGLKNPKFREIIATKSKTIPWEGHQWDRKLNNHNKLLSMYEGCDGGKTGFTKKSGRCLVSTAERNGIRLIVVTLNAPNDWEDHKKLLDKGFSALAPYTPALEPCTLAVKGGICESITAETAPMPVIPLLSGDRAEIKPVLPSYIDAPVEKGQTVGYAQILLNGVTVAQTDIIASEGTDVLPPVKYGKDFLEIFKKLIIKMCL